MFLAFLSLTLCGADDELYGHIRLAHEVGLDQHDRALLEKLFRDVWQNENLIPEYRNDFNNIRCPKTIGKQRKFFSSYGRVINVKNMRAHHHHTHAHAQEDLILFGVMLLVMLLV